VDGSVTAFDAVILGALLLSGLLAMLRGFMRESLSAVAFVAAALGAIWMLPVLREPAREAIQPGWAADTAAIVGAFLLIFLAITLITSSLSKSLQRGEPGMLDRVGGLAFGVGRGLVLLALFVLAYTYVVRPDRPAEWLTEARLYPLIASTAAALQELAPESSRIAAVPLPDALEIPATERADSTPAAAEPSLPGEEAGYGERTRQSLDQLIGAKADDGADPEADADIDGDTQ
jgi:membrane protein required for colicin V production